MAEVSVFQAGGYRCIKAGFQYSGGVAAEPGYEIERARFASLCRSPMHSPRSKSILEPDALAAICACRKLLSSIGVRSGVIKR